LFDPTYDSFRFFDAFALREVGYRLGLRRSAVGAAGANFLVVAPGAVGKDALHARPVCADPRIVSELIGALVRYYDIQPHALHVSIQPPRALAPRPGVTLPASMMRCLLALGGDLGPDGQGVLRVRRVAGHEILRHVPQRELDLMRVVPRPRRSPMAAGGAARGESADASAGRRAVAHYRFARLARPGSEGSYEPLLLALKGLQLHHRPGNMLLSAQMQAEPAMAEMFESIDRWCDAPEPIDPHEVTAFLDAVAAGLAIERRGRPAHSPAYLNRATAELAESLKQFNISVGLSADR